MFSARYFFLAIVSLLFTFPLIAQEKTIDLHTTFWGFADNREYKTPYTEDKTIIGTLISPTLHFSTDKHHHLYGGIHYLKDFGSRNQSTVNPIIYYNYSAPKIDFYIGHIPRSDVLPDVHPIVLSDTFLYDRPNVEGLLLHYHNSTLSQKLFIDWTSKQSETDREQFIVGWLGHLNFSNLYVKNDALLWHNALTKNAPEDQHIRDNALVMLRAGYDFTNLWNIDSLTFDIGISTGIDRVRSEYDFQFSKGFVSNLNFQYKNFLLKNTLYLGEGNQLPNADKYYYSSKYDRIDIGWIPFKNRYVESKLLLSFHFTPGHIDNQQFFSLKYNFGQSIYKSAN